MKVNFNVDAKDFAGKSLRVDEGGNIKTVNLSDRLQELMFFAGGDGNLSNEQKYQAYKIGKKLASRSEDFTVDELSFIKEQAGGKFVAGLYGQICDLIEHV